MKIYTSIQEFTHPYKTIVTLGTFDGVHNGHKRILDKLIRSTKTTGYQNVVLTFFPHPRMVLQQNTDIRLLNTINEKAFLLDEYGIDNLIVHPFDHAFSRLTAEDFVKDILVDKLNIHKIIIGHDHRFGRNRTATIYDLIRFGEEYGFEVEEISAFEINEVSVSSTKIRNALTEGNIEKANKYLGYPYFITGSVVKGRQMGRTIHYPTANISVSEDYKLIPANGVYIVTALVNGKQEQGMMNIGNNPTIGGDKRSIEVHLFNFDEDIYDAAIKVNIHQKLRDEVKFESVNELKAQLDKDKQLSLHYFNNTTA